MMLQQVIAENMDGAGAPARNGAPAGLSALVCPNEDARSFSGQKHGSSLRLLVVSPFLPSRTSGACTRSFYLLKALAGNFAVSLIALVTDACGADDRALAELKLQNVVKVPVRSTLARKRARQLASVVRGRSYLADSYRTMAVQQAMDRLFALGAYDAVLFDSVFMADYRLPPSTQVLIGQHNIEHELLYRTYQRESSLPRKWYNWWESRRLKPIEIDRCRRADTVLVTSQREAQLLKRLAPDCVVSVVPNGVDVDAFQPVNQDEQLANSIVFTGAMDYYPNIDAVVSFARECWPLIRSQVPALTWRIVGRNPPQAVQELSKLPGVEVTGAVPDVKPYLAAASVAIAPLRIGSGTRLKILEALAMGKAVVSTSLGCEGLDVATGKHLIVADRPEEFARSIMRLLQDAEQRSALGSTGRALTEQAYSWQRCGDAAVRAVQSVAR